MQTGRAEQHKRLQPRILRSSSKQQSLPLMNTGALNAMLKSA